MLALALDRDRRRIGDVFESAQFGIDVGRGLGNILVQVGVAVDRHGRGHALVVEDFQAVPSLQPICPSLALMKGVLF